MNPVGYIMLFFSLFSVTLLIQRRRVRRSKNEQA
jgi:hypothetical protein